MFVMHLIDRLIARGREARRGDTDAAAAWFEEFRPILPLSWRAKGDAPSRPTQPSGSYCG